MKKNIGDFYFITQAFLTSIDFSLPKIFSWKTGTVVVKNGKIISKARNSLKNNEHAEQIAIKKVKKKDFFHSTLYTTLPPCILRKTVPSCSQIIINSGIKKVVCLLEKDFNPSEGDLGLKNLRKNQIEVRVLAPFYLKLFYLLINLPVVVKLLFRRL